MTPSSRPGATATRGTADNVLEDEASEAIQARENVVNEDVVRAAAGITMALGGVAFVYAYFDKLYWPLQVVATLFFVEFLARLTVGISRSPVGLVGGLLMRRQRPDWVSAKPKRFAWRLGLVMSGFHDRHNQLRHPGLAAEIDLLDLSGAHVARVRARTVPGLRGLRATGTPGLDSPGRRVRHLRSWRLRCHVAIARRAGGPASLSRTSPYLEVRHGT